MQRAYIARSTRGVLNMRVSSLHSVWTPLLRWDHARSRIALWYRRGEDSWRYRLFLIDLSAFERPYVRHSLFHWFMRYGSIRMIAQGVRKKHTHARSQRAIHLVLVFLIRKTSREVLYRSLSENTKFLTIVWKFFLCKTPYTRLLIETTNDISETRERWHKTLLLERSRSKTETYRERFHTFNVNRYSEITCINGTVNMRLHSFHSKYRKESLFIITRHSLSHLIQWAWKGSLRDKKQRMRKITLNISMHRYSERI